MRTPITYYGGKQRLASTIINMMQPHKIYCEPFFGGGDVFFSKPKSKIEVINDKRNDLINFYTAVQNNFEELNALIQGTLHSETMYQYAKDIWNDRVESDNIQKAWSVWMITNGSFGGSMHGGWKWCNGTSGSHSGIYIKNKRLDFSEALRTRLSETQISCRDALDVIRKRDSTDTFFYLDPPYPGSAQSHYSGYTHKDLSELLSVLGSIKGKFILSNYWCQTLRYHIAVNNWNFKSIKMDLKVNNLGHHKTEYRTEILIYNYDIEKNLFD